MAFSGNDLPLGPNGQFPRQRIATENNPLMPVMDAEGAYLRSPVAQLPTEEKEYSSVVKRATGHMNFGEVKQKRNMDAMGKGFQRDKDRKKLKNGRSYRAKNRLAETNVLSHGPVFKMSNLEETEEVGLSGVVPKKTSSGRAIARTWNYGRSKYYATVPDSKGVVETGVFAGARTIAIDYTTIRKK